MALLAFPSTLPAQSPQGALWESYRRGTEILAQAVAAHGGAAAIVFNDCRERRLCCRIVTADGHERSFDWPIQAVHPHGTHALSLNYLHHDKFAPDLRLRKTER